MSSPAGWYPDPGGQRGAFRYWNGSTWSAQLSSSATAPPPASGLGQPPTGAPQFGQYGYEPGMGYAPQQPQKKRNVGLWIGIIIGALVIALIGYGVFRLASQGGLNGTTGNAGSNSTQNPCPKNNQSLAPVTHSNDGRVHGGLLSYPRLGAPWSAPQPDTRVPFGRDVQEQIVTVEDNYQPGNSWVASVLVGELVAGDGFFSPQEGSEIVVKCLIGVFYGDAQVGRDDKVSKATKVGGKDAWLVETHLTFDIKGLKTKGETAIVLIVATSAEASSLFYASIPDTSPQYMQPARDAMAALTVGN